MQMPKNKFKKILNNYWLKNKNKLTQKWISQDKMPILWKKMVMSKKWSLHPLRIGQLSLWEICWTWSNKRKKNQKREYKIYLTWKMNLTLQNMQQQEEIYWIWNKKLKFQ